MCARDVCVPERERLVFAPVDRSRPGDSDVRGQLLDPQAPRLEVAFQDALDLACDLVVIFADDFDVQRAHARAAARDAPELAESALDVAGQLDIELQAHVGGFEADLGLEDGAAAQGVAVEAASLVVSQVDARHDGAVRADVGFDQLVRAGVVAVLTALVHNALVGEHLGGCEGGGELLGSGKALCVGASDLGQLGESKGLLLVRALLAELLDALAARGAARLDGGLIVIGQLSKAGLQSPNGGLCVPGRDGQVDPWPGSGRDGDGDRQWGLCDGSNHRHRSLWGGGSKDGSRAAASGTGDGTAALAAADSIEPVVAHGC
jgi:hypothetical protein